MLFGDADLVWLGPAHVGVFVVIACLLAVLAGGISQALLTTLFGLIVAMIIQVFNNYFTSRIDKLIIDMEESSVELIEALADLEDNN